MAHAIMDRLARGLRGDSEPDPDALEAFDRAADARGARLLGEGLSPQELRELHRRACEGAPVRVMRPRR